MFAWNKHDDDDEIKVHPVGIHFDVQDNFIIENALQQNPASYDSQFLIME